MDAINKRVEQDIYDTMRVCGIIPTPGIIKTGPHTYLTYGVRRDKLFTEQGQGRHRRYQAVVGGSHIIIEDYEN